MIRYFDSAANITPEMLEGFFEGWRKPRSKEDHLKILQNSDHILLAIDTDTNQVVGFVTALSDDVQSAFIPLLEVLSDYRGQKIGSNLMLRMLKKLKGIPAIDVICDPELQKFYSKFGMKCATGMIIRDY